MIKLKERKRLGNNSKILIILKEWQRFCFNSEQEPNDSDIFLFLEVKFKTSEKIYIEYIQKWTKTRYNREFLNIEEIKDWFEFYYS